MLRIDEMTAWSLLRAVPSEPWGSASVRVRHDSRPDVWLQVGPSGDWQTSGEPTSAARDLLDLYLPLQTRASVVIAQIGQSLDGRIATSTGQSHYITGPADIRRLHRLRALVDAVIVGAGTVAADDPRLTVRLAEGPNPVRVVLDPRGRLGPARNVFTDQAARTIVIKTAPAGPDVPVEDGVVFLPPRADGMFEPERVLSALRDMGLHRILVEGGGATVSRFVQAGVVNRLHVTVAPMVIGSGRSGLTLDPIDSLDLALKPVCRIFRLGDDVLFDLDFGHFTRAS